MLGNPFYGPVIGTNQVVPAGEKSISVVPQPVNELPAIEQCVASS
jgi:hypothetical protein